ncbi:MAG: Ig-like domain-containing protein [Candidatus Magasanikbacteria bacterium]|nr:Ig-like domain-containing protein [Candidatus Magasanikbacteria bacterium]
MDASLIFGILDFNMRILIVLVGVLILAVSAFFIFKKARYYRLLILLDAVVVILILLLSFIALFSRPFARLETLPEDGYLVEAHQPIEVSFTAPINPEDVSLHMSPEVDGEWVFDNALPFFSGGYADRATFIPKESFYPETKIVVYVVGLKRLFPGGTTHEQSIEFFSPNLPNIKEIYPKDGQENVSIKDSFEITFDAPSGEFVDWVYEISPPINFTVDKTDNTKNKLIFSKPLLQDREYSLSISRAARSYRVSDFSDTTKGDLEFIQKITFKTVAPPFVKLYDQEGSGMRADSPIKIVFSEAMNPASVAEKFSLNPATVGTIQWEDEKTFIFLPDAEFRKGADYTIKFLSGMENKYGGKTDQDIELHFSPAGAVAILSVYPKNASYGLPLDLSRVIIEFDQEVEHESAQNSFSISPNISGSFSWDGNKMIYSLSRSLDNSTKYTIKLKKGIKTVYGLDSEKDYNYSFTTKDKVFSLNIPMYYQSETFTCNIAATRMVLAYRDTVRSENSIKAAIGEGGDPNVNWVEGYGVHWGPISNFIDNYRSVSLKRNWNVVDLVKEVQRGNPVIIWGHNQLSSSGKFVLDSGATGYHGMHSVVVKGFVGNVENPTSIIVNDPWRGPRTISVSSFKSLWAYIGNTALVIY